MALVVLERGEGGALHGVDVEAAVQMVDFMLKDARVPSLGFDDSRCAVLVEVGDADRAGTRHGGHESRDAEAAFVGDHLGGREQLDLGVDDDVEVDRLSLAFFQLGLGEAFVIFDAIFDDRQLQGLADLRCGQADSRGVTHGLAHVDDEVLDEGALYFFFREGPSALP